MRKKNLSILQDEINRVFRGTYSKNRINLHRISKNWFDIIGEKLFESVKPYFLKDEILYLNCIHQGWIQTLSFYKSEILTKIQNIFHDEIKVKDINFVFNKKNFKDSNSIAKSQIKNIRQKIEYDDSKDDFYKLLNLYSETFIKDK